MLKISLAVVALAAVAAQAAITNVQNVNLLENYGLVGGTPQLLTTYSDTASLAARHSFDGGYSVWANVGAGDKIRYTLPQAVTVDKFYLYFGAYGQHIMEDFTIRYSDTIDWNNAGWGSVSSFTPSPLVSTGSYTADIADASVKYVELTVGANCSDYNQLGEFMAIAPTSTVFSNGYNIMADQYTEQNYNVYNGSPWDPAKDPYNAGLNDNTGYWQVNFGSAKAFNVVTFSWYPGQGHDGIKIYVSNDGINFGSPIWTGNGNSFKEAIFSTVTAQYLRVMADSGNSGAMNDIHVFNAVPEPATLALLALGGLGLLRRRS